MLSPGSALPATSPDAQLLFWSLPPVIHPLPPSSPSPPPPSPPLASSPSFPSSPHMCIWDHTDHRGHSPFMPQNFSIYSPKQGDALAWPQESHVTNHLNEVPRYSNYFPGPVSNLRSHTAFGCHVWHGAWVLFTFPGVDTFFTSTNQLFCKICAAGTGTSYKLSFLGTTPAGPRMAVPLWVTLTFIICLRWCGLACALKGYSFPFSLDRVRRRTWGWCKCPPLAPVFIHWWSLPGPIITMMHAKWWFSNSIILALLITWHTLYNKEALSFLASLCICLFISIYYSVAAQTLILILFNRLSSTRGY